jgi:hypothetical protein
MCQSVFLISLETLNQLSAVAIDGRVVRFAGPLVTEIC